MKIRMWYALPALVMLAGCATNDREYSVNDPPAPTAAPPQRVDAVSDALGAKMDGMLANLHPMSGGMTR